MLDQTRRGFLKFLGKAAVVGAVIAAKPEMALSKVTPTQSKGKLILDKGIISPPMMPRTDALVTNGKFSTDIKDWADNPRSFYARSGAEGLGRRTELPENAMGILRVEPDYIVIKRTTSFPALHA